MAARTASLCGGGFWQSLESVRAKQKHQHQKTRGSSPLRSTSTAANDNAKTKTRRPRRVIDPDDLDDLDDLEAIEPISQDHALTLFFRRPPGGADHVMVVASTPSGDAIVEDRSTTEVIKDAARHANAVSESCVRWAQSEGRQTRFRVTWQAGDRVLASHQLVCGDGDPTALDGTVDSFLSQQQRHSEVNQRLHHEGFSMVQDSWNKLMNMTMRRVEALEKDNELLRERLRKAGDVDAEILAAQAAADIDQRVRTTEIVESRLLPILQQLVLKGLGGGGADVQQIETVLRAATGGDASKLQQLMAAIPKPVPANANATDPIKSAS